MKLVHLKSKFTIIEFHDEKTIVYDRVLEKEMAIRGIVIPPGLRYEYEGKSIIRLGDKEFQKAFKEIYIPQVFNANTYRWKK